MSEPVRTDDAPSVEEARLVRPLDRAQIGGVAAGIGDHLGVSPLTLRAAFVVLGAWQLVGVAAYVALWLVLPPERSAPLAPGVDAATRRGLRTGLLNPRNRPADLGQLAAFGLVGVGLVGLVQGLGWGLPTPWLVIGLLLGTAVALVWWQADHAQRLEPEEGTGPRLLGPLLARGSTLAAHAVALGLAGVAVGMTLTQLPDLGVLQTIVVAALLVVGSLTLLLVPWVIRSRRALAIAREQKMVSDARADMAAHLHDSVLQTLALIQRRAHDPQAVTRLARRQERELRAWLYGRPDSADTLAAALRDAALEIEDDFPIAVEVVAVGEDVPLTPALAELVRAAREAMVNAAKHAGVPTVDVYAEVDESRVEVFVRDRGRGFVLDEVADDRLGVRRSILERMERHHGVARIRSDPQRGTEVTLEMER